MKRVARLAVVLATTFAALAALVACRIISPYDATSYKNATDLKAESLTLVETAATGLAAHHETEIAALVLRVRQATEYEIGKGDANRITVEQWHHVLSERADDGILGRFLKEWSAGNAAVGETFAKEKGIKVGEAFDEIIKLERGKLGE